MFGQTIFAIEANNCQNYTKRRRIHLFRKDMIIMKYKKEDTLIYTIRNNLITYFDGSLDVKISSWIYNVYLSSITDIFLNVNI